MDLVRLGQRSIALRVESVDKLVFDKVKNFRAAVISSEVQ